MSRDDFVVVPVLHGVREFRQGLRRVDRELDRELARRMRFEVAQPVSNAIRDRVPRSNTSPVVGGPASGRRAKKRHWYADIRPEVTAAGNPAIVWGRQSTPYAGWLEFGGRIRQPRRGVTLVRARVPGGRYVYPEVGRARPRAVRTAQDVLSDIAGRAGIPVESRGR
jgi:hypothetical protein